MQRNLNPLPLVGASHPLDGSTYGLHHVPFFSSATFSARGSSLVKGTFDLGGILQKQVELSPSI